jgi:hypothetical protein
MKRVIVVLCGFAICLSAVAMASGQSLSTAASVGNYLGNLCSQTGTSGAACNSAWSGSPLAIGGSGTASASANYGVLKGYIQSTTFANETVGVGVTTASAETEERRERSLCTIPSDSVSLQGSLNLAPTTIVPLDTVSTDTVTADYSKDDSGATAALSLIDANDNPLNGVKIVAASGTKYPTKQGFPA